MNERLNFSKSALIFMSSALFIGGFISSISIEIINNGFLFVIPYLVFLIIGFCVLRIEHFFLDGLTKKSIVSKKSLQFVKTFLSFNSISSIVLLAFFSFIEIYLSFQIANYLFQNLNKLLNPDYLPSVKFSNLVVLLAVLGWLALVYLKLFTNPTRLRWVKAFHFLIVIMTLGLIPLLFFQIDIVVESVKTYIETLKIEDNYLLRPNSIWELNLWHNAAGKSFILLVLGYFYYKSWKINNGMYSSSNKVGFVTISIFFAALGFVFVYYLPKFLSKIYEFDFLQTEKLPIFLGVASLGILLLLVILNSLNNTLFSITKKLGSFDYLDFQESRYLTKQNIKFVLISSLGLASGILFVFVDFVNYFHWLGMVFIMLLTFVFVIQFFDYFSYNKINKSFDKKEANYQLSSTNRLILKIVIPTFLIPILFISLPDFYSNFLGNKRLVKKIEYLQDLGKITSNHHSLEPYILRDYNKVVMEIDYNKVVLDKIDSLKPIQKDSIQLYLENRNYKMNEDFRISKLQFYHNIVFVKNFSKWFTLIFILIFIVVYGFKLKNQ